MSIAEISFGGLFPREPLVAAGLGAMYFGYGKVADPVRVAVIGTGDEGNVLIGGCNPEYVDVKAICDIRPFGQHRAFHGDWSSSSALGRRPGLIRVAGYKDEAEAKRNVKVYDSTNGGIMACLDDPDIEAVIIALPLWLHASVAAQAMKRGLHVLTEKIDGTQRCPVQSDVKNGSLHDGHQWKSNPFGNGSSKALQRKVRQRGELNSLGFIGPIASYPSTVASR